MSQLTHPKPQLVGQIRSHKLIAVSALLALLATTALVLVLAIGDSTSTTTSAVDRPAPTVRADNGPEETAAAINRGYEPPTPTAPVRPDESTVASAISGR